ncbi:hypothetical protein EB796_006243 [Bugula neritina]|uniref:Uncharacterized protein n=1 Tax=Bugula neritina TaxID=10212 RepID=A0A7J7K9X5_BUGNE|nr:hypothetical protein EB796_006243 [Bugula neritina]
MFEKLGRPNIFCKILHPAYPDGIQVDFGELALVVITPADLAVQALVNGKEVNTVQLEGHPVLVTFRLKYLYGPNGTQVLLYDDVHKIHAETVGLCPDNIFLIVCEASISDTFTKAGRYNITMSVAVGNEVEAASTVLTILPPTNVLRFLNPHRVVSDLPVFYFPFGDTLVFQATLSLQFETAVLTNNTVRYSCSFGDQAQEITVDTGTTLNVSHKYMSTREAGFNVFVKATSAGVTVNASARVIIYKPIQRVELLAKGQGWTENNQGIIHFTPDQVENGLLLQLRVEPEDTPFSSCHILKGEVPGSSIVKSFLPENSNISMYYYDHTFTNIQQKGVNPR